MTAHDIWSSVFLIFGAVFVGRGVAEPNWAAVQELIGLSLLRRVKWQSGHSFGTFRWHITPAGKQALKDNT